MKGSHDYRSGIVRDEYWRAQAEQAVADWHRRRGTTDPTLHTAPPLNLRERFSAHRLDRVQRTLEATR